MIIVLVILLLFGPSKIPEIARGIGKGLNEFKRASEEIKKEINAEVEQVSNINQEDTNASVTDSRTLKNSVATNYNPDEPISENISDTGDATELTKEVQSSKKKQGKTTVVIENNEGSGI